MTWVFHDVRRDVVKERGWSGFFRRIRQNLIKSSNRERHSDTSLRGHKSCQAIHVTSNIPQQRTSLSWKPHRTEAERLEKAKEGENTHSALQLWTTHRPSGTADVQGHERTVNADHVKSLRDFQCLKHDHTNTVGQNAMSLIRPDKVTATTQQRT